MRSILKKFMILLAVVPLVLVTGEQVIMDPSMKRIQEDMSVDQGYHVNLRRPEKFGKCSHDVLQRHPFLLRK